MKHSLQRHLSLVSASVILLAGLIAAVASFGLVFSDAKEFQDDMLRQIANLSTGRTAEPIASDSKTSDRNNAWVTGQESKVSVFHLPNDTVPA